MSQIVQEITEDGLRLPRQLLEELGYAAGGRVVISTTASGLTIRPAELTLDDVKSAAIRYLLREVGDMAGVGAPEESGDGWITPVLLKPEGTRIGQLYFDRFGSLLVDRSSSPDDLADAADAAA